MEGSGDQRFTYRGVDPDQFLDMNNEQLMELFVCRIRRKFSRGLKRKPMALIKKLRKDEEVRESGEANLMSYNDGEVVTCIVEALLLSPEGRDPRDVEIGSSSEDWAEEEAEEVGGQRQQVEERQRPKHRENCRIQRS